MPTILQLRRGTTAEHSSFTGAVGEITVNTTKDTLVVHDGSTQGGFEIALADLSNTSAITLSSLSSGTGISYNNSTGEISADTDTMATKSYVDTQVQSKDALSELSGTTDDVTEGSTNLYYTAARANADFDTKLAAADTDDVSEGSTNLYYTTARANADFDTKLAAADTDDVSEGSTNQYYTDARVKSLLTVLDGSIVPSADVTYDLGSSTKQWRDIYVGPGSLYVNGQQVVSDNSGTITISADSNQNVAVQTSGSGDIELDPTGTGTVQVKGTLQIEDGQNITNSAGNDITFANNIKVDQITTKSTDTNLVLSGNGTGNVTVNDDINITGNLTVGGTTTTVNSETINLADNTIVLNSNFTSGSPTEDAGISISRGGSTAKTFLWDETNDKWTIGSETFVAGTVEANLTGNVTGNVTGDLTGTASNASTAVTLTGLTASVSELNLLDGVTASTVELNYVDGVTSNIQTQLNGKATSAQGALADSAVQNLADLSISATAAELNLLDGVTATTVELNYVDGVTSSIQTQLNAKLASASYTAADVLAKLKTVDGSGSGLDSDLLDGQSSAYYRINIYNSAGTLLN